ncbi:MAG: hypothetical protein J1F36_00425 [Clostridiales bacterium]|nr:hypothetical protein [Clostridiales bacterium]
MKNFSLLEQCKSFLKMLKVAMPITSVIWLIIGIVFCIVYGAIFWLGLIVASIGIVEFVLFLFIRNYLVKIINFLENENNENNLKIDMQ